MILIKDRHKVVLSIVSVFPYGKYDTYKGSTHDDPPLLASYTKALGKYDTYKGSTHGHEITVCNFIKGNMILIKDRHFAICSNYLLSILGKYDTYKGSTPTAKSEHHSLPSFEGNMILIKDRHRQYRT